MARPQVTFDFFQANAFSDRAFGGNPATILFLDEPLADQVLENINKNFNQPIVVFVSPPKPGTTKKPGVATFGLRWFGPQNGEVQICGHGTLAATGAIFQRLPPAKNIRTLEFQTLSGLITATRADDGKICMDLPAGTTIPATQQETESVRAAFCLALKKPTVALQYVAHGGPGFEQYLFVEVPVSEELAKWTVDSQPLLAFSPRTHIVVVTSASADPAIAYETRMFAPKLGVLEDHACGSAHCLNAPFWAAKHQRPSDFEQHARSVSMRSGDIWATHIQEEDKVRVRGDVKITASGILRLDLADM
ncbi:hypothetical protein FB45DRAFT_935258 [Roridomyces roridus]|uniref:Uncharacterized protein n=1 Tax=Roridomyces roridus TaxID=1738132 RepID=A0AAD7BB58_9AGAR|nr:hypothetical protein FB45DRAFT_935258 [Roridomyces roridus]